MAAAMHRVAFVVLLLAAWSGAADEYRDILYEAHRLEREIRPGDDPDDPVDRAYERLAAAAAVAPHRWEAFLWRGLNRCAKANVVRGMLQRTLESMRARGATDAVLEATEVDGRRFLQSCLDDAYQNFAVMDQRMRKLKQTDPDRVLFASACMKYAGAEFLKAKRGEPGAIDDFKLLVRRGFQIDLCRDLIAKSYNELGAIAYTDEDFEEAQEHWDKGLKWVSDTHLRRVILTNKAGAFELDNEFGLAEALLREQIESAPNRPGNWKNLGLLLGFQGSNREALHAYKKSRDICKSSRSRIFLGVFHGNSWLRAGMIHGKLLETDGDLRLAWRLFLEYRRMFGDDYNFSLAFGDFLVHMGRYTMAWSFLTRARDLQPHCPIPYKLLLQVAPRTEGTRDEVQKRVQQAKDELRKARERFLPRSESMAVKRICGGMRDVGDGGGMPDKPEWIRPDPLAGFDVDKPPAWLEKAADERDPFRAWQPGDAKEAGAQDEVVEETSDPSGDVAGKSWLPVGIASVAVVLLLLVRIWRRRR